LSHPAVALRTLAAPRGFHIGTAVAFPHLRHNRRYAATLAREFSMLTAENTMKWAALRPDRQRYDFTDADYLARFAAANHQVLRGHTLLWHQALPAWLSSASLSNRQWENTLRNHIDIVVHHFRGQVQTWDVVNEAIDENKGCALRDSLWLAHLGPDYIARAFRWAHAADPAARLYYNDYGAEGMNRKSDAVYRLVSGLLEHGVPMHGVGLQMHVSPEDHPRLTDVARNMRRLGKAGLAVQVTELDVRLKTPVTPKKLAEQARLYRDILQICLDNKNCTACVTWGFTDAYSWVPGFFKGYDQALLFDAAYRPKPAYQAWTAALTK